MIRHLAIPLIVAVFCFIGVVDQIQGRSVHVELSAQDGKTQVMDMPLWMFPCQVKEGDMFYFTKQEGVLELRCGEPPE